MSRVAKVITPVTLAATAGLAILCAGLQWHSGAYSSDLAGHPDEPAHVVSGLMVHDYLGHLLRPGESQWPLNPRAFAESYYVHYPKAAIGRWPPLFYLVQSMWMFAFGRTKASLLVLMLAIAAATAVLLFHVMQGIIGAFGAFVLSAAFLLFPISQQSLFSVMPDALLGLLFCAAAIFGAGALEGRRRWWIVYGLGAAAALLVHGRGAVLVLAPWIAILLARRIDLLKHRGLWAASGLALLLILVWSHFVHQIDRLSIAASAGEAIAFPFRVFHSLGPIFFLLAALGAASARYRAEPAWAWATGVLAGTWLFFCLAIVRWDDRYLVAALPACMVLSACGLRVLAEPAGAIFRSPTPVTLAALAALVAGAGVLQALPLIHKPNVGYERLVGEILDGPDGDKSVYLVAGDSYHEGSFIVSLALREPTAGHIVLRSTKLLARTDWLVTRYEPLFRNASEMVAFLNESWISLVVIQEGTSRPDVVMLRAAMRDSGWLQVAAPAGTLVYRRTTPLPAGRIRIRVDMRRKLGKYLEAAP